MSGAKVWLPPGLRQALGMVVALIAVIVYDKSFSGEPLSNELQAIRLLAARCAVCHSTDLIVQQRLDREHWVATVNKMVHWGAQLSAVEQVLLVDYLATQYHPGVPGVVGTQPALEPLEAPMPVPTPQLGMPKHPAGRAERGQGLYGQNCLPCHGEAAIGGMGPKLAKNPILTEERRFWETVSKGRGAMPPWGTTLSAQEIADIHAWLKSL
jgi:cytochrome c oxidase cbb3-type subunit 3